MHLDRTTNSKTTDSSFYDLLYQLEQVLFLLVSSCYCFVFLMIYPLDLLKPNMYIKLNTKTQNIFFVNENLKTFFIHFDRGDKKTEGENSFLFESVYTSRMLLKNWVLVFSFMYLVSVDPMDRSYFRKNLIRKKIRVKLKIRSFKIGCWI